MPSNPKSVLRRLMPNAHRILIEQCIKRDFVHLTGRVLVIGAGHDPYRFITERPECKAHGYLKRFRLDGRNRGCTRAAI